MCISFSLYALNLDVPQEVRGKGPFLTDQEIAGIEPPEIFCQREVML